MTKKHFTAIANLIKDYASGDERDIWALIYPMADYMATLNPLFDRQKFIDACTPNYMKEGR